MTTQIIKKLRDMTGSGILDCKLALQESDYDLDKAIEYLRKKGMAKAKKKHSRNTPEGLVALKISENKSAIISLYSETDFVVRNQHFQNLATNLVNLAVNKFKDFDSFQNEVVPESKLSVQEEIANNIGVIGENIALKQVAVLEIEGGHIFSYVHNSIAQDMGKIGVLLSLKSDLSKNDLLELGKNLTMQIAATKPDSLSIETLDADKIEKEKNIIAEQVKSLNKPDNVAQKMIEGKLKKYFEESVLLEQQCIVDSKLKVKELIEQTAKKYNTTIQIGGYKMLVLGEDNSIYSDN